MDIERLQVEGGFLDGLDIRFSGGLNVIIGARGTGKTSVIELIRYALASSNHTAEAKNRSLDHARAVLDGGEVSVVLNDIIDSVAISRSFEEDQPRSTAKYEAPIILSQTEVETLGLSDAGRLSLIDGFIKGRKKIQANEATLISSVKAIYKEIEIVETEINLLSEEVIKNPFLLAQLQDYEKQLKELQGNSIEVSKKQEEYSRLSEELAATSARKEIIERFVNHTSKWNDVLNKLIFENYDLEVWREESNREYLDELRRAYEQAIQKVMEATNAFEGIVNISKNKSEQISSLTFSLERQARILRLELDKVSEGTGALSRNITNIKSQIAQITLREKLLKDREEKLVSIRTRRNDALNELGLVRAERYNMRGFVANKINNELAPFIKIEVDQSSQLGDYSKALIDALKGSGIKYNDLVPKISEYISPRELVTLVDMSDFESLAEVINIPKERAARVLSQLREYGLADILTCEVQDEVRMYLLDGVDYKEVSSLSAGQRCTVILSIVLQHSERVLIIDQPEDHLDNAFVANTIIKTLNNRKGAGQIILSTHNANIPVLGGADLIIELSSDGRNGFVQVNKPLTHPEAVTAITTVMEGGSEAFATRAKFYKDNLE